ncbi:Cytochrome P450 71C1 [Triticum urartu]|uniref:Cytochrome P450 71C1 n=1 Tax=Triticum urartu TaxID=4572 RepID=M7ZIM2_TRIUA|nr:Cytochrome P450 71C1 [Triticum urartu]
MDLGAIATPQSLWLVLLFLIIVYLATSSSRAEKLYSKLPSPPFKLPLIGHLHLVGSLPHVALRDLATKHGPDVMLIRLGVVPTLVVSSPRAAKAVLRTYDHLFASRPHSPVGDILFSGSTNIAFAPYGDYWRQLRKIVTTHLLSARKAGVGGLPREAGRNKMFRELLEINSKLLGGFILTDFFPSLARLDMASGKAVKQKKIWDDLLDDLIDKHASKTVMDEDEQDFIDVLLSVQQEYGLTKDNIKAILMDMFEAGTDTTYVSLDYAMAELMRNPRVMTKLQAEVRSSVTKGKEMVTEEDLASMSYLKAVMKEAMRLHPSGALLIPHLSVADCDVEGYTIPSGTRLMVNAWALGRDPTCWDNAEEFVPERFLEGAMDAACDFQGNDFRFLPFGSGRRICPGITFAAVTFEIILANLIYHFNWELPEGSPGVDMTEEYGIDVHRKVKLLLVPRMV